VKPHLADTNPAVKSAAEFAAAQLGLNTPAGGPTTRPAVENKVLLATLTYEQSRDAALKLEGDAKLGAQLFLTQGCVACHTVSKSEPPKGPYLGDVAKRYNRGELIESILKPNEKIAQGFTSHYFIKKNRERIDGFVVREAGDETEVRGAAGTSVVIKTADVARTGTLPTSIMPEGLAANLTPEEFASLLSYLGSLSGD
jgi:putative heme-binding domain-containing protein